jgi:hypothetical protein
VAKLADARDLKSRVLNGTCGFDSRPGHHVNPFGEDHRAVTIVFVALRLGRECIQFDAVQTRRIHGDSPLRLASQQTIDGLFRRFAEDVSKHDIDRADRGHADSLAAERHGLAIHVLPQELGVPWILAHQQRLQVEVDRLFRDLGRERGVANPDVTGVVKTSTMSQP